MMIQNAGVEPASSGRRLSGGASGRADPRGHSALSEKFMASSNFLRLADLVGGQLIATGCPMADIITWQFADQRR